MLGEEFFQRPLKKIITNRVKVLSQKLFVLEKVVKMAA